MDKDFEKWWSAQKLGGFMNDHISPEHVRGAWDEARRKERAECQKIAAMYGGYDAEEIADLIGQRNFK